MPKQMHMALMLAAVLLMSGMTMAAEKTYPPEIQAKLAACFEPADATAVQKALDACTELLAMKRWNDTERGRLYMMRGNAADDLGNALQALADFNKAAELLPNEARVFFNRGVYYMQHSDNKHAKADFTKAVTLDKDLAPAHYNLGVLAVRGGDFAFAVAQSTEVIRIMPENADAYLLRSLAEGRLGQNDAAAKDAAIALKLDPSIAKRFRASGRQSP